MTHEKLGQPQPFLHPIACEDKQCRFERRLQATTHCILLTTKLHKTLTRVAILHKNKAGLIASFTTILSKENINVDDMTNKSRGDFAYTLLDLGTKLTDAVVEEIKKVDGVIKVRVVK